MMGNTRQQNRANAKRIIDTAIEVLEATGWCRGKLGDCVISTVDEDGQHCSIGSTAAAHNILFGTLPVVDTTRWFGTAPPRQDEYGSGKPNSAYRRALQAIADEIPEAHFDANGDCMFTKADMCYLDGTPDLIQIIVDYNDALGELDKPVLLGVFHRASMSLA